MEEACNESRCGLQREVATEEREGPEDVGGGGGKWTKGLGR